MADSSPPRLDGDDRRILGTLLRYERESLARKVDGVDEWDARRALVPSGTSLLWLVRHMAWVESWWVEVRFAGRGAVVADDEVGPDDTVTAALDAYRSGWSRVDSVIEGADLDDVCRDPGSGPPPTLRWVLAHLLQETARHAGHADILREQIDGLTGR
ncbi:DinB family protein [Pseudonocardia humida]|uniref:DinB family protein n=1 Tax=Pseudonocardia humida TaxID=2800819 RepID=A0ABT1A8X0_9PSEU|nr:DUF664 domain-containing protein [Pseudonocardia humida]MCO1659119.1 DinB family protein [Pseudonocardia humida]